MRPNKLIADACYGNAGVFLHEGECPDSLFRARTVCQKTAFYATKRNIKGEWRRGRAKTRARAGVRGRKRGAWAAREERSRGRDAGGATGRRALRGYEGRTETPLQNSQRVLLAKPRPAAVSHRGRRSAAMARRAGRPGGRTSRPTATGQHERARQRGAVTGRGNGANCVGVMAVGRDVPIAPPG